MSKDKLLSDEELATKLIVVAKGIGKSYDDSIDAKIEQSMISIINTQKRLYAESVIGEDEPEDIDDYPFEYGKQYGRNELRSELRTKLAKWLNQPTVNQSASVSRSDEGGESTKEEEE